MECNLSTFADDNKLGGAHAWRTGDLEEGLDRLEHWAISSGMNFSNSRMLGVALVTEQCHMQEQTGRQEAERQQLRRKGPGSAGDSRLTMSHQCVLAAKRANCVMECITHSIASWSRGASPAIFRVGVASPWILCAALGSASSYQYIKIGSGILSPVIDTCYWHWRTMDKTERGSYQPL